MCAGGRAVSARYLSVSSSTGKKPQVAPYSGDMLPIVARSAIERFARPGPKNSTNLPTTPRLRSICVTVSTRLVADAGARRHDAKVVERFLRPFQEFVALPVLPVFLFDVPLDCVAGAEDHYRHRVIANKIDRNERIDFFRIAAEHLHGIAHGGEIDDRRNAGEVLHQHARGPKGDLAF